MAHDLDGDDLTGTPCLGTDCFDTAEVIDQLAVRLPLDVGAVEDSVRLDLPLCGHHAHLLRMGGTRYSYTSRE